MIRLTDSDGVALLVNESLIESVSVDRDGSTVVRMNSGRLWKVLEAVWEVAEKLVAPWQELEVEEVHDGGKTPQT